VGGTLNLAATPASSLNVQVGTVTVGQVTNIGNDINASVNFDSGSVTLTNLQLASLIQATLTNNTVAGSSNGTFTVGGASPNTTSTAVLTVTGQTSLAKRTITTSGGSASGSLVINGGTANLLGGVVDSSTVGSRTTTFTLAGGTLNMGGTAIGSAAA